MANQFNCRTISTEEELEIIKYYKDNSLSPTASAFHIGKNRVLKILFKYNIELLSKQDIEKLRRKHTINTCQELYGCNNGGGSADAIAKIKSTKLQKYGDANYNNNEKNKLTCLKKYGTENVFANKKIQNKIKSTLLNTYGVEHPSKSKTIRNKAKQTMQAKYGCANYSQTLDFHKKARKLYKYNDQTFDSLPELAVYIYCIDHHIKIERCPVSFKYTFKAKCYYYFPDFNINGKLVEIKGDHFFKKDGTMCNPFDHSQDALYETKHQCGIINEVVFWQKKDYLFALDYFKTNYKLKNYTAIKKYESGELDY